MKVKGTQKIKSIVQELLELERLIEEFRRLKARQAAMVKGMAAPREALVTIESDLYRLQRRIQAREAYTNPWQHINWN
jgi:hypothetical protein